MKDKNFQGGRVNYGDSKETIQNTILNFDRRLRKNYILEA